MAERSGDSAFKPDAYHRAASWVVDDMADGGGVFRITKKDGTPQVLGQVEGMVNGKPGVFEWIIENGLVVHQRFRADSVVNGIPN